MNAKRWLVAVWLCGVIGVCQGQVSLTGMPRYFVVLKGAATFTTSYVVDNTKQDLNVGLSLDRLAIQKPKIYYYLVLQTAYEPTTAIVRGVETWTGEGHLEAVPIGMVTYGTGRFVEDATQPNGWRWDATAKYSFDIGGEALALSGFGGAPAMGWLKKGSRIGTASMWWWESISETYEDVNGDVVEAGNPYGLIPGTYSGTRSNLVAYDTMTSAITEGPLALLAITAKKMQTRDRPPVVWYQATALALTVTTPFWMQVTELSQIYYDTDANGDAVVDEKDGYLESSVSTPLLCGMAAIKFTTDSKLTTLANKTPADPTFDLDAVSTGIDDILVKAKYAPVAPVITPFEPIP